MVYGDETHCVKMRALVVYEGKVNMRLYLDHDYDFQCACEDDVRIYAIFCSFYKDGISLDVGSIEEYYKRDVQFKIAWGVLWLCGSFIRLQM